MNTSSVPANYVPLLVLALVLMLFIATAVSCTPTSPPVPVLPTVIVDGVAVTATPNPQANVRLTAQCRTDFWWYNGTYVRVVTPLYSSGGSNPSILVGFQIVESNGSVVTIMGNNVTCKWWYE